jgi:hypothetical protein
MKKSVLGRRRLVLAIGALGAAAALAGCSATGGGQLAGINAQKATFAFSWVETVESNGSSNVFQGNLAGTYLDGYVKLRFTGSTMSFMGEPCTSVMGTYTSTNRAYPGSGSASLHVCDNGQGQSGTGDTFSISLTSGPYAGYSNSGTITHGNITINNQAP